MKVKILVGLSCAAGTFAGGDIVDIPDDIGGSLIKFGHAEAVEETRTAAAQPVTRKATKWQKQDRDSDGSN
jgi:hypothetical protein